MSWPEEPSSAPTRTVPLAAGLAAIVDEGNGPPVLALHGLPGSARDFRWLAPPLSRFCRLIRLDLPGFGDTPLKATGRYDLEARAEFVHSVMEALDLKHTILMGHSIGAPLAIAVAARHPKLVGGLVLISPVGLRPHPAFRKFAPRLRAIALENRWLQPVLLPLVRRAFARTGFSRSLPDEAILTTIRYASTTRFEQHVANAAALRAPTLIAWSEDDHIIPPEFIQELAGACPGGPRLVYADGGHNLQKSRAIELADAIERWAPWQPFAKPV
jgi:pimeloyl-ACP methyl ester carboxylesterase